MKEIPFKVEKSKCEQYVRVTLGKATHVLTIAEWSKTISQKIQFSHEEGKVQ